MKIPRAIGSRHGRSRHLLVPVTRFWTRLAGPALQRVIDWASAALLVILLSPLLLLRGLHARLRCGCWLRRRPMVGRYRVGFDLLEFASAGFGRSLPRLFNLLGGSLSLAGPRPLDATEAAALPPVAVDRYLVRPGIFSPHGLRQRVGIAFDSELDTDLDYVYTESFRRWAGTVVRGLLGGLLGGSRAASETPAAAAREGSPETPDWLNFLGIRVANLSMDAALDRLDQAIDDDVARMVNFVNPHCLNVSCDHPGYREVLQRSHFILPDGIGLHQGCRLLGCRFNSNINGTDLFPRLCEMLAETGRSIYLLGAQPGAAAASAETMQKRFPRLVVAGTRDGYFETAEEDAIIQEINASGADVLLVAMGVPRQELWIDRHLPNLEVGLAMGVGGLFDYYSGRIPRAPQWVREIGMEWVWRLLQEPGRMWKRYLVGNFVFLFRVWRQARAVRRGNPL